MGRDGVHGWAAQSRCLHQQRYSGHDVVVLHTGEGGAAQSTRRRMGAPFTHMRLHHNSCWSTRRAPQTRIIHQHTLLFSPLQGQSMITAVRTHPLWQGLAQ